MEELMANFKRDYEGIEGQVLLGMSNYELTPEDKDQNKGILNCREIKPWKA